MQAKLLVGHLTGAFVNLMSAAAFNLERKSFSAAEFAILNSKHFSDLQRKF
jgi:hypothetical protein